MTDQREIKFGEIATAHWWSASEIATLGSRLRNSRSKRSSLGHNPV
jgi:hypothetical protein